MIQKIYLIAFILFSYIGNLFPQDKINEPRDISLHIAPRGFVLSSLTNKNIDPFYHASGLLNTNFKISYKKNFSISLRAVSEVCNFSKSYENAQNMYFWSKPSISFKTPVKFLSIDTFQMTAADLGRLKNGQGLSLEHFESQGATFNILAFKKINFYFTAIGYGWTGRDDIYMYGISYDSLFGFRILDNHDSDTHSRIFSSDFLLLYKLFRIYGEIGYNYDKKAKGVLSGIEYNNSLGKSFFSLLIEYRHYDKDFLKFSTLNVYPYFNSLTSLDKPLNNFRYYQVMNSSVNAFSTKLNFRYFIFKNWFTSANLEFILTKDADFAYEANVGYEVYKGINLNVGLLNKFFQLFDPFHPNSQMFSLHKDIWVMVKANYAFDFRF